MPEKCQNKSGSVTIMWITLRERWENESSEVDTVSLMMMKKCVAVNVFILSVLSPVNTSTAAVITIRISPDTASQVSFM